MEGNSRSGKLLSQGLIICPYLVWILVQAACTLAGNSGFFSALSRLVQMIYAPMMLLGAGIRLHIYNEEKGEKKGYLIQAAICFGAFFILSYGKEVVIAHKNVFETAKNLLVLVHTPIISNIFLTMAAALLLYYFLKDPIDRIAADPKKLLITGGICLLTVFFPRNLLGYGLFGIFIGSDSFSCIPLSYYVLAILFGMYLRSREEETGKNAYLKKPVLIIMGAMLILGAGLFVLGATSASLVFLGYVIAWVGTLICLLLISLFDALGRFFRKAGSGIAKAFVKCRELTKTNRAFDRLVYYVFYIGLFLIIGLCIFVPYLKEGRTLIWSVDGLGQYVPKIYRFMADAPNVVKSLLHGSLDFKQYDFSTGLGAMVTNSHEPIYWLYLLFTPDKLEAVYSITVLLRYLLAGISLSIMLRYFKKGKLAALIGSLMYAFSGYAIYAGTKHAQFLVPLILLPIFIVAIDRLITEKKWYLFTICTFVSLLCSYYFLYMNTIALGIYFLVRIFANKEYRNVSTFINRALIIIGSYLLGVGMSCISLFTQFGSYLGSGRTTGASFVEFLSTTPLYYRAEWLQDLYVCFTSDTFTPGLWLKLGFPPAAFLALVMIFTRKRHKETKPLFLIGTLFCIFPIFGYIFSGFSIVNNRWCYIYAVLVAFILATYFDVLGKLETKELIAMVSMVALYSALLILANKYHTEEMHTTFITVLLTLIVILVINSTKVRIPPLAARLAVFAVTAFAIVMNARSFVTPENHMATYVPKGTAYDAVTNTSLADLDELGDTEGFYRSTNLATAGNVRDAGMVLGYNDISTFTSTLNGGMVDYNAEMGNCCWNKVSIYSYNYRTILNQLASVKYVAKIVTPGKEGVIPYGYEKVHSTEKNGKEYNIYKNKFALPLGYTYDNITAQSELDGTDSAVKQEATTLTAIIEDDQMDGLHGIPVKKLDDLDITAHKLKIKDMKLDGVTIDENGLMTIEKEGASIDFTFDGEPNAETYIAFDGEISFPADAKEHFIKTDIEASGIKYEYKFRIDAYSTNQPEYLFNLGYHKDEICQASMTFKAVGTIQLDDIAIYSQSYDSYADRMQILKYESLTDVQMENNGFSGRVNLSSDKLMVVTLPYQKGWTAYVDGEKTDIYRANYQYMALALTKGDHEIRMTYEIPGIKLIILITAGSFALFLLIILVNLIRKKRKPADQQTA